MLFTLGNLLKFVGKRQWVLPADCKSDGRHEYLQLAGRSHV